MVSRSARAMGLPVAGVGEVWGGGGGGGGGAGEEGGEGGGGHGGLREVGGIVGVGFRVEEKVAAAASTEGRGSEVAAGREWGRVDEAEVTHEHGARAFPGG